MKRKEFNKITRSLHRGQRVQLVFRSGGRYHVAVGEYEGNKGDGYLMLKVVGQPGFPKQPYVGWVSSFEPLEVTRSYHFHYTYIDSITTLREG